MHTGRLWSFAAAVRRLEDTGHRVRFTNILRHPEGPVRIRYREDGADVVDVGPSSDPLVFATAEPVA